MTFPVDHLKDENMPREASFDAVLGIRPEQIAINTSRQSPSDIEAHIYTSMPAGSETLVTVKVGGVSMVIKHSALRITTRIRWSICRSTPPRSTYLIRKPKTSSSIRLNKHHTSNSHIHKKRREETEGGKTNVTAQAHFSRYSGSNNDVLADRVRRRRSDDGPGQRAAQDPNEAAAAGTLQLSEWEESSGIFNTDETDEELYEKAKEEGKVTIYSISSRITKVANAFMEKYPGIEVEPFDISTNELLEKVTREYDAGQHVADVVHIKDQDGTLYNEYILARKFYNYKPADILSHIDEKYTKTQTPMYVELTQLFYNSEAYPDGSPVTNIWQLTEPEWKGRVMMQNRWTTSHGAPGSPVSV